MAHALALVKISVAHEAPKQLPEGHLRHAVLVGDGPHPQLEDVLLHVHALEHTLGVTLRIQPKRRRQRSHKVDKVLSRHQATCLGVEARPHLHEDLCVLGLDRRPVAPESAQVVFDDEHDHHLEHDIGREHDVRDEERHREDGAAVALLIRAFAALGAHHHVVHQPIPRLARRAAEEGERRAPEGAEVRVEIEVLAVRDVAKELHTEERVHREHD